MNPHLRIAARLTLVSATLTLAACAATSSYSETAPADGWNLTGIWVLNPALSTDTQKALAGLAPRPRKRGPGDRGACGPGPGGATSSAPDAGPDGCTSGGPGGPDEGFDPALDPGGGVDGGGPGQGGRRRGGGNGGPGYSGMGGATSGRGQTWHPPLDLQSTALAAGGWLQLKHRNDELVISNANGSRSYTPGVHSVVSVETGVADQSSGWKGRGYTIEIKPQVGPRSVEQYELSADGRQLLVHISFDGEGPNKALKVVRVYDHATAIPAESPPGPKAAPQGQQGPGPQKP